MIKLLFCAIVAKQMSYASCFLLTHSYELMVQCWEYEPEKRPTFKELHSKTVSYIERIAGYLEMNFTISNPLTTISDMSAPEAWESEAQTHSGNEQDSSDTESDAF